MQNKTVKVKI